MRPSALSLNYLVRRTFTTACFFAGLVLAGSATAAGDDDPPEVRAVET
jgi:hypothetical protein